MAGVKANSQLFEAYLKCPTKCWLRSRGETGEGNRYAEWVKERNETYRAQGAQRLWDDVPEAERVLAPPMENLQAAKWRLALDVVAQAVPPASSGSAPLPRLVPGATPPDGGESDGTSAPQPRSDAWSLESRLHAVERVASEGRGKPAGIIPIRFIFRNKLSETKGLFGRICWPFSTPWIVLSWSTMGVTSLFSSNACASDTESRPKIQSVPRP